VIRDRIDAYVVLWRIGQREKCHLPALGLAN